MADTADILAAPRVDLGGALSDMVRAVLLFLPKALAFVLILVAGWLVARLLRTVVDRVLERVGFDRWVDRGGIRAALARSRYDASDLVAKLVYYTILLFTLQLAFGIWGRNAVSDLIHGVVAWLPKAFVAILIVVVAAAIASAVRDIVGNALGGLSYGRILGTAVSWFIVGIGVIAALNQVGIATTVTTPILIAFLATVAGILVVGVGGGLVRPMQQRWERWLDRAAEESQAIAEHARAYSAAREAGQEDARAAMAAQATEPTARATEPAAGTTDRPVAPQLIPAASKPPTDAGPVPVPTAPTTPATAATTQPTTTQPTTTQPTTTQPTTTQPTTTPPTTTQQVPPSEEPTQVLPPFTGER